MPPAPPRPTGVERNLVLTLWDVGDDHSFMHDLASTDKNRPTVNPNGPIYAVSAGHGSLVVLNQRTNSTEELEIPTRAPRAQVPSRFPAPNRPSLFWGERASLGEPAVQPGRPAQPDARQQGSRVDDVEDPAQRGPRRGATIRRTSLPPGSRCSSSGRQASFYDPKTKQFVLIDTCYATHHLQFDNDANETVYFNELSGPIVGWIDSKVYDETKDEQKAVGWCGQVVDTNGDGRITRHRGIRSPAVASRSSMRETPQAAARRAGAPAARGDGGGPDPKLDTLVSFSLYGVIPSPVDDSVWGVAERFPGYLVRVDRGKNPPQSCMAEIYRVPEPGFDPRGVDIDTNGVVWTALAASSHLASFDRRKCKRSPGPRKVDGSECAEGWTLYETNGPKLKGTNIPADFHYYNWVDQHNVLGSRRRTSRSPPGPTRTRCWCSNPQTRQWVTLRVPYPLGFYSRGLDGRIDDPNGGWKGRALYANYGTHFVWHIEGGKGTKGKVVKFQLRPDPLAR